MVVTLIATEHLACDEIGVIMYILTIIIVAAN